jgi:hypothetical protein
MECALLPVELEKLGLKILYKNVKPSMEEIRLN